MNKKREGFGVLTASLYLCTQNEESAISLSRRSIPGGGHLGLNVCVHQTAAKNILIVRAFPKVFDGKKSTGAYHAPVIFFYEEFLTFDRAKLSSLIVETHK